MTAASGRTCAGDSGGPLILRSRNDPDQEVEEEDDNGESDGGVADGSAQEDLLVGHVSFGFPRRKGQGCPQPNPATVFTDLRNPDINAWLRSELAAVHQQLVSGNYYLDWFRGLGSTAGG